MKKLLALSTCIFLILIFGCNKNPGSSNDSVYFNDNLIVLFDDWHMSSMPMSRDNITLVNRGHMYWYNPYNQVQVQEVWPDSNVSAENGGFTRMHVLDMVFTPNLNLPNPEESWYGIQRALPAFLHNQSQSRYIELWVKGDRGNLNIDLGQISEDAIPNLRMDTEDKGENRLRTCEKYIDEDTGLDGVWGGDPPSPFHPHEEAVITDSAAVPYDFWDLNMNKTKEPDEPWSFDNWHYNPHGMDYRDINGTEINRNSRKESFYDSEDINQDSHINFYNHYFHFRLSLDKNSADTTCIAEGGVEHPYGWALYRIPLSSFKNEVGFANWTEIQSMRLWVDGVLTDSNDDESKYAYIRIASIEFVCDKKEE
jgi:hypothetical protein